MSFLPLSHFLRKKQAPTAPPTWIYSEAKSAKCFHLHALEVGWVGVIMWRWVDLHFVYQEFLPRILGRRLCITWVGAIYLVWSLVHLRRFVHVFLGNTYVLHGSVCTKYLNGKIKFACYKDWKVPVSQGPFLNPCRLFGLYNQTSSRVFLFPQRQSLCLGYLLCNSVRLLNHI